MNTMKQRFTALDGLRGLAAFAVVLLHYGYYTDVPLVRGAWAAVDLFFVLSGFVLQHTYGERIASGGMSLGAFLKVRVIRLYPLYLVGLAVGIAGSLDVLRPKAIALSLVALPYLNRLPWPVADQNFVGSVFPYNGPAWSLFFEFFVGLVFFAVARRGRLLLTVAGLSLAVWLACWFKLHAVNPGPFTDGFIYAFPRVMAMFFVGVVLRHFHRSPRPLLFVGLLCLATWAVSTGKPWLAQVTGVVLAPALVFTGAGLRLPRRAEAVAEFAGSLSYPLYAIHVPLFFLLWTVLPVERGPKIAAAVAWVS